MTVNNNLPRSILAISMLFFSAQLWAETDCSKDAIGFYLDKGFTPEQVTQMCQCSGNGVATNTIAPTTAAVGVQAIGVATATTESNSQDSLDRDELLFFSKSILSDTLTVTPDTLTYVIDECIKYGEEDITGFRPKLCAVFKTTINRVGLIVVRAVKRMSIFRDAELVVKGDIQREVVNINELDSDDRKTVEKIIDLTPETFQIVTREGIDPTKVAARLAR